MRPLFHSLTLWLKHLHQDIQSLKWLLSYCNQEHNFDNFQCCVEDTWGLSLEYRWSTYTLCTGTVVKIRLNTHLLGKKHMWHTWWFIQIKKTNETGRGPLLNKMTWNEITGYWNHLKNLNKNLNFSSGPPTQRPVVSKNHHIVRSNIH